MIRKISYSLIGAVLLTGFLFKFMHWPYTLELFIGSLGGVVIALLELAFHKRSMKLVLRNTIYPIIGAGFLIGLLFKMLHWPFADYIFIVSMSGMSFAFLEYALSIRKSVLTIIPTLFGIILVLVLFKVVHWPMSEYVLDIVSIAFTVSVPILLLRRSYQLKQSAPNLKKYYLLIIVLFVLAALTEYYLAFYQGETDLAKAMPHLIHILMLSLLLLVMRKALQLDKLKERFQTDRNLIQCLGAIVLISLVFQVLVSQA